MTKPVEEMTPKSAGKKEMRFKLDYVSGVEGNSIYLNDHRIAGPKPWGGGKILKSWEVSKKDILYAIGEMSYEEHLNP